LFQFVLIIFTLTQLTAGAPRNTGH